MMRTVLLTLSMLTLAACAETVDGYTAEDALTARSVAGEEERLSGSGLAPESGDLPPMFRGCDAQGGFAQRFAEADADADGLLTGEEARATFKKGGRPPKHFGFLFWVYDADDSESLDEAERSTLLAEHTARCEALHDRLLAEFDADGDGTLSEAEQEAAREAAPPPPEMEGRRGGGGRGRHHGERGEGDSGEACERPEGPRPEGAQGERRPPIPPPVIDLYDADGDGILSETERATARAAIRANLAAGEPPFPRPEGPPPERPEGEAPPE